jgi:hypothetical protein
LWFVVCVLVFGLGGSARVAPRWGPGPAPRSKTPATRRQCRNDLSLARLPSHPHPGTTPFSSPSVCQTAHAGQHGRRASARRSFLFRALKGVAFAFAPWRRVGGCGQRDPALAMGLDRADALHHFVKEVDFCSGCLRRGVRCFERCAVYPPNPEFLLICGAPGLRGGAEVGG